jgi:hypothetical protein
LLIILSYLLVIFLEMVFFILVPPDT